MKIDIAIIGHAGRFPGARDLRQFWRNLCAGTEQVRTLSDDVLRASGVPAGRIADPNYVKREAQIEGYDLFDAAFFGYTAREATLIDPQQRLFLETCWEALEDAGYDPERLQALVGVYAAAGANAYLSECLWPQRDAFEFVDPIEVGLGNSLSSLPTRVSYKLNLKGPSVAVQTACSSSLVAVHLAVQSLLNHECDMALAGGVFLKLPADTGYTYRVDGLLSPDGRCRPFDAEARGTIFGSGVGAVVLKRLEEAQADRDAIRAIIKGSAVSNDGSRKAGFSAPSQQAQAEVISEALGVAGVEPATVTYVEAHGTGTALGDPIEVAALTEAFGVWPGHRCAIGSVKANIGHLDAAAGIAGLIKTVLALEHREIPPTINFNRPNPAIDFDHGPFQPNLTLCGWTPVQGRLRAGVSSFGLGGTNCHVVLEDAPPRRPSGSSRSWQLLPVAAKSPSAVQVAAARLAAFLEEHPDVDVADVAYTYQAGRPQWNSRRAVVARSRAEAAQLLRVAAADAACAADGSLRRIVLFLPAGSAPFGALAACLQAEEPAFRQAASQCAGILGGALTWDRDDPAQVLAFEYALASLWMQWGITFQTVRGAGVGEIVASVLSGRAGLRDALRSAGKDEQEETIASTGDLAWLDDPPAVILEMGDSGAFAHAPSGRRPVRVLSMSDADVPRGHVHGAVAALWAGGVDIPWGRYRTSDARQRVAGPTYPFERKRFWIEARHAGPEQRPSTPVPLAALAPAGEGSPEARITEMFRSLLFVEEVGPHESFITLGGDSLLATQLASRLRDVWGVTVPLRTILERPTVAAMAELLAGACSSGDGPPPIPRIDRTKRLPLSSAQERLWFLDSLTPGTPFYNVSTGLEIQGELDEDALDASLGDVIARHEALRTSFALDDEGPVQVILTTVAATVRRFDLQDFSACDQEHALRELSRDEARAPFDLTSPPLLRVSLIRLAPRRSVVVLTIHHIVADGWSLNVLIDDIAECYRRRCAGEPSSLPPLPIQYAEYVHWQHETLSAPGIDALMTYWRERLGGELPILALPADFARPRVQTHRGERQQVEVSAQIVSVLRGLAADRQMTLYMVLLAGFATLLHRYTGQEDLLIGSPVANRRRSELEGLIGCFVNVLVMRVDASGNPTFDELLRRVRETALDGFGAQELPFERLVAELKPARGLSHPPIVQALFVLQNTPSRRVDVAGVSMRPFPVDPEIATYDIIMSLDESGEAIVGTLEYNADLFLPGTIRRLIGHFQTLLESLAANPDQRIGMAPCLRPAERRQLLHGFNSMDEPPIVRCFHAALEAQARRAPDAIALCYEDEALSYGALERRANQLARYLQRFGAGPEVVIGLCLERSIEAVVALFAILKAGAAYLPLDPAYPSDRLAHMVEEADVPLIVTHRPAAARLPRATARVLDLDALRDDIAREADTPPATHVVVDNLAYVIYTSGSTGKPKGVMITHRGLENVIRTAGREFATTPEDRVLLFTSLSFDASVLEIAIALGHGAQLVLTRREDLLPTRRFVEMLGRLQITSLAIFPSALALLDDDGLTGLRTLIVGGEPCPPAVIDRWRSGRRMFNSYGPCETTIWATSGEFDDPARIFIGKPIPNVSVYVLDRFLHPVPIGVPGELFIAGVGLARGYAGRGDDTAERFLPDPFATQAGARMYRTGDRARWSPDGRVALLGRVDDQQVKVQGVRIELRDVEAAILRHPRIKAAAVRTHGEAADRILVAYVVAELPEGGEIDDLRAFLGQRLPGFMIPSVFMRLAQLPLLASGKVEYRALPAPDRQCAPGRRISDPPATQCERRTASIVEALVGVSPVGRHDDLFDLGAHSLLMARLKSELDDTFGCDFPMLDLFQHPTVAGIAECLEGTPTPEVVVAASRSRARLRTTMRQRRARTTADGGRLTPG